MNYKKIKNLVLYTGVGIITSSIIVGNTIILQKETVVNHSYELCPITKIQSFFMNHKDASEHQIEMIKEENEQKYKKIIYAFYSEEDDAIHILTNETNYQKVIVSTSLIPNYVDGNLVYEVPKGYILKGSTCEKYYVDCDKIVSNTTLGFNGEGITEIQNFDSRTNELDETITLRLKY